MKISECKLGIKVRISNDRDMDNNKIAKILKIDCFNNNGNILIGLQGVSNPAKRLRYLKPENIIIY